MIELNSEIQEKIESHGQSTYPHECCGFMFGKEGANRVITEIMDTSNIHEENHSRRFRISPGDYMKAEKYADDNNLDFLGIYHSHPDHPSLPSEHDRKQAMPFFSYFILSVKNGKPDTLQSWRLNDQLQFEEEKIKTI